MTEQNQTPSTAGDDDTHGHMHAKSDDDTHGHMHAKSDDDTHGHMHAKSGDDTEGHFRLDTSDDEDVAGHKHWTDEDTQGHVSPRVTGDNAEDDVEGHTRPW